MSKSTKPARTSRPKSTTPSLPAGTIPPQLTEHDLECERIAEVLRASTNIEALAADFLRSMPDGGHTLEDAVDRVAWHAAEFAIDLYDLPIAERDETRARIQWAMLLPRDAFEASLDMIDEATGRGWDIAFLQARHPGVPVSTIARRIAQLRSAYVSQWWWRIGAKGGDGGGDGVSTLDTVSSWLDQGQLLSTKTEEDAWRRFERGEVTTVDTHIHTTLLSDDEGFKRAVFVADAAQLVLREVVARVTRAADQAPAIELQAAE